MKESLNTLDTRVGELENKTRDLERLSQKNNQDLFIRIMNLERYSRDYHIYKNHRCGGRGRRRLYYHFTHYLTMFGFQDVSAEVENAHRTMKRNDQRLPEQLMDE